MSAEKTEKPKRGRPAGSKNVYFGARLKDLCGLLNPDAMIPLPKHFALALKLSNSSLDITEMEDVPLTGKQEKIDFVVK